MLLNSFLLFFLLNSTFSASCEYDKFSGIWQTQKTEYTRSGKISSIE